MIYLFQTPQYYRIYNGAVVDLPIEKDIGLYIKSYETYLNLYRPCDGIIWFNELDKTDKGIILNYIDKAVDNISEGQYDWAYVDEKLFVTENNNYVFQYYARVYPRWCYWEPQ